MASCSVCACVSKKNSLTCPGCAFFVCEKCVKQYILDRSDDIHCMNCKTPWSSNMFSPAFYKGPYRAHREKILFAREQSLMPETQPFVVRATEITNLEKLIKEFKVRNQWSWRHDPIYKELMEQLGFLHSDPVTFSKKGNFFRKCSTGTCLGFYGDDGICSMCQTTVCVQCAEKCVPGHVCNPDTLETLKLIKSDSKPCPKCHAGIFRIEGCLHMWCTQCNTSFHWSTGVIYSKPMANPHYAEYMRKGGSAPRELGDVVCGGIPSLHKWHKDQHMAIYQLHPNIFDDTAYPLREQVNKIMFLRTAAISEETGVIAGLNDTTQKFQNLRVKFMLGELEETAYKSKLFSIDKAAEKEREELVISHLFCTVIGDLLRNLLGDLQTTVDTWNSGLSIIEYCNEMFDKIGKRFGTKPRRIEV